MPATAAVTPVPVKIVFTEAVVVTEQLTGKGEPAIL